MPFVLDASVTLAWALDEHKTEAAEQALRRLMDDTAAMPVTVDHEGPNHAWSATMELVRRHRLTLL
jgi:predicted nucleic acid-binding protein